MDTLFHYNSKAAYYKILLPSTLPNVDKIIYIDSDAINLEDLSEMYNIKLKKNMYFCWVTDYIYHLNELKNFGFFSDKYINSGIMIMNLKALRENSIDKKLIEFVNTHPLAFVDQTAINCVCHNNIQVIPFKYNVFAFSSFKKLSILNQEQDVKYRMNESELNKSFNEPTLLHYFTLNKPWEKK